MPDPAAPAGVTERGAEPAVHTRHQAMSIMSRTCDLLAATPVEALCTSAPSVRSGPGPRQRSRSCRGACRFLDDRWPSPWRSIPEVPVGAVIAVI
jgi:hypothetical protein